MNIKPYILFPAAACLALLLAGCSSGKNTANSRWWQSFNTRYNVYYNGNMAYIDGALEKENGHHDNFTELIPLYAVGNKKSRTLGKDAFDRAIEKSQKAIRLHSIRRKPEWNRNRRKTARDIEWLGRKEYNPFLWKAWMLMGRAQFHQGDFDAAASTFAYMSRLYETQPAIYGRARAWLAKSYIENGFLYDAEDVIRNMERDSIHWRAQKEWDYTYTDYYIHTGEYAKAIPYLKKVIGHEMRKKQKAREYFLLGQLQAALGRNADAYASFRKVIRQNPPFELEFNARVAQTEVMADGQAGTMIARLRRMAASDKNKDYLDRIYYAIGNICLSRRDTAQAIANYERGYAGASRNGIEKGMLLLKLGDLYWMRENYNGARRCYGEAIGLLDSDREDYRRLSARSKVLDELIPHTDAVHLQDSLLQLAAMSEPERNAAIDRVIRALEKKEKEERDREAGQYAEEMMRRNGATGGAAQPTPPPSAGSREQGSAWYFYNPMAVEQGKRQFRRLWGKRENTDDWQRSNLTVVAGDGGTAVADTVDGGQPDSTAQAGDAAEPHREASGTEQNDPHRREYYLAQIPFTEEQAQAARQMIMDGLYHSGVIFKDRLDNLPLSEKALMRLVTQYPSYDNMDEAYYHLFLLYSRRGRPQTAQQYVERLKAEYPASRWTRILTDPYFTQNAREGVHIEDSLYAATYEAFKAGRTNEVRANAAVSETRFPLGANRDKFLFVGGMARLDEGDVEGCVADMRTLVGNHPRSRLAETAGMILNGVKQGRRLRGGRFDPGDVWARRSAVSEGRDSARVRKLTDERNTDFVFMLVFRPDSVNRNRLLFELARHNFTKYPVRDFAIDLVEADGLERMQVSGFRNHDEARQYVRELFRQAGVTALTGKARPVIVSEENLPLLGTAVSYDEYARYYDRHFAPLRVADRRLLSEPADIVTRPGGETDAETDGNGMYRLPDGTTVVPPEEAAPTGTVIPADLLPVATPPPTPPGTTVIPQDQATPPGTTVIPQDQTTPPTRPRPAAGTTVTPAPTPTRRLPAKGAEVILDGTDSIPPSKARPKTPGGRTTTPRKPGQTPLRTGGKPAPAAPKTPKTRKAEATPKTFDLEDEYYDLEGF